MTQLSIGEVRESLADTINQVAYTGQRIILNRHGKQVAALIPIEDLALLEALEDQRDVREARAALSEAKKKGTVSWQALRDELSL